MIINAKYASSCNVCGRHIGVGEKIEWSRGARAVHAACAQGPAASVSAAPARRSYRGARGKWNGCSCGAREMPDGSLSANACATCRFDAYDC